MHNSPIYFPRWHQNGISHLHHLFENNSFNSFNTLVQRCGVGREEFLHYHQIKHLIKAKTVLSANTLTSPLLIDNILKITSTKKLTSKLYKLIITSKQHITLPSVRWERDLGISPNPDFWISICQSTFSMTLNTNLQLIQYKTLHRTHLTQNRLHKMKFSETDICSQCTLGCTDSYFHATWDCTPVCSFWSSVTDKLSTIFGRIIPLNPLLCLLGDTSEIKLPLKYHNALQISLTIAKKIIFQNWKSKNNCNITHWTNA